MYSKKPLTKQNPKQPPKNQQQQQRPKANKPTKPPKTLAHELHKLVDKKHSSFDEAISFKL